ncbi:MAG: HEPN-associated N-terminal domain-containing protein [Chloroflexi bacterium]|nr:HEPN-associated N-terminal domain-containing protein [Chloroflexota bacterium]
MGIAKERKIKLDEEGLSVSKALGRVVCAECFGDHAIREYVASMACDDEQTCDYCRRQSPCAEMEDVLRFISKGLCREYGDPNEEGLPYEEGEFFGSETFTTEGLIEDEIGLEVSSEELLRDIVAALKDDVWCRRDPWVLPAHEALILSWEGFAEQVKHRTRYVFFRTAQEKEGPDREWREVYERNRVEPAVMLDKLGRVISGLGLARRLGEGEMLFRVRLHKKAAGYRTVEKLGPPPRNRARSTRMSPAGIPMFYVAREKDTALAEMLSPVGGAPEFATVATFRVRRPLSVLDLTKLGETPSLFDDKQWARRATVAFMHDFVHSISRSITRDDMVHVDYVPSQVFTEYVRHLYADSDGSRMQGIAYPSSRRKGGVSLVLFLEQGQCGGRYRREALRAKVEPYVDLVGAEEVVGWIKGARMWWKPRDGTGHTVARLGPDRATVARRVRSLGLRRSA